MNELRKPWKHDKGFYSDVLDCDGNTIAECDAPDVAEEIVKCCNAYADLQSWSALVCEYLECAAKLRPNEINGAAMMLSLHPSRAKAEGATA